MTALRVARIREAAELMRQRAAVATPGPWRVEGESIEAGRYDEVLKPGPVSCMAYCFGGSSTLEGDRIEVDLAHIAGMHPAVALAVADWLVYEACKAAFGWNGQSDMALAVANTYLREQEA
jgi:hypothetical protein